MPLEDPGSLAPTVIGGAPARPGRAAPQDLVRVALLDDHAEQLERTAAWLRAEAPGFDVVLAATTWVELVHSPAFPSDLVLLDVQLSEPVAIEARVRACRAAGAQVVVLTALEDEATCRRALGAGAEAFLGRSAPMTEVLETMRAVTGLSVDGAVHRAWRPAPAEPVQRPRLSLGEESALRLYAAGRSTNEVAEAIGVRFETAKTYLKRVRDKYARAGRPAGKRADLVQRATEDGYL